MVLYGLLDALDSSTLPFTITLILVVIVFCVLFKQNRRKQREPPVLLNLIPHLGSALTFGADPLKFLHNAKESLGSATFASYIAGKRMVFFTSPSSWPEILRAPPSSLRFDVVGLEVMANAFSVPNSKAKMAQIGVGGKATHAQFIKYLSTKEHLDNLSSKARDSLYTTLTATAATAAATTTTTLPLYGTIFPIIFRATMCSLFGNDHPLSTSSSFHEDFSTFDDKFPFLAGGAPPIAFKGATSALARLASTLTYKTAPKDASGIMKARHELFSTFDMSDKERSYCQVVMVWAAVANTIPACAWTILYILKNAEAKAAVEKEVRGIASGAGDYDVTKFDEMPILTSCVTETLRLTSASLTVREVGSGGFQMKDGTKLREGDRVAIYPPILHFDNSVFEDSKTFRYDR
ncbi:hypothetical protein TL16_g08157 [Triparma laevis f. inornata]|nr:hypothetical protein TrLO_g4304 [Triparma laevis f. longispina]GMH79470.1 hypothetical protein TL16_g08157 [Triparma laevis f. inornata]